MPRQKDLKHYNYDSFDGLGDPEEHINYFEQIALIYYYNDLTRCRFFASTLKGGAQKWFSKIPSRTVGSWKQFRELFLKRFRANRTHELHMCHLETVRQRDNESLADYMKRFQEAINKVSTLDEREALSIFRRNLDPGQNERYILELINKEPQSLAAAYAMAARFIKESDVLQAMRMTRQDPDSSEGKRPRTDRQANIVQSSNTNYSRNHDSGRGRSDNRRSEDRRNNDRRDSHRNGDARRDYPRREEPRNDKPFRPEPKPEPKWTPLNRTRAEILREIKGKPFYQPPKPMLTSPERRSTQKNCEFHETHGHDTEECLSLKYFLEDQVEKGNLNQYLERRNQQGRGQPRNVVNMIMGGRQSPPQSPDQSEDVMIIQSYPEEPITFGNEDFHGLDPFHNQAIVVSLEVLDNLIKKVLVDTGSAVNIIFQHALNRMNMGSLRMDPCNEDPLYGLGHNMVPITGVIYLPVTFGMTPKYVTKSCKFYVLSTPSSYNMILGRTGLSQIQASLSTPHLKVKFQTPAGVGELRGDREMADKCYGQALCIAETDPENKRKSATMVRGLNKKKHREPKKPRLESLMIEASDFMEQNSEAKIQQSVKRHEQTKVEPAVDTESVIIDPEQPNRKIKIGTGLETVFKQELTHLLREYADVFAWGPEDMPGIDESVAMHSLDVDPKKKPVKQKRRNFAPERQQAIDDEVEKLLKADIICEIKYPDWLANVVLVKKPNGKWRMCVDYTDLNSACPKDSYPLPIIDQLIDATSSHVMLSFNGRFLGVQSDKNESEETSPKQLSSPIGQSMHIR